MTRSAQHGTPDSAEHGACRARNRGDPTDSASGTTVATAMQLREDTMTRSLNKVIVRALIALAALASGSIALGCSSEVQGGGEGGGGSGGSGGSGAQCNLGDARSCPSMPGQIAECIAVNGKPRWAKCC